MILQMPARQFFSLQKHIKRIRARYNFDLWTSFNLASFKDEETKEEIFQDMVSTAFPDSQNTVKPYWEDPEPGLKFVGN